MVASLRLHKAVSLRTQFEVVWLNVLKKFLDFRQQVCGLVAVSKCPFRGWGLEGSAALRAALFFDLFFV